MKPGGNFEFEGMVTETLAAGKCCVSLHGQKLTWDRATMKVNNSDFAQKYIRPERRKGWETLTNFLNAFIHAKVRLALQ